MTSKLRHAVILSVLLKVMTDAALPVAADDSKSGPAARASAPQLAGEVDDATAKAMSDRLQAELNQPNEIIIKLAQKLGREVISKLDFGSDIARLVVWEKELEQSHKDLEKVAEDTEKERKENRAALDAEIAELKVQLAGDKARLDQEIVSVIKIYKPILVELKANQEACQKDKAAVAVKLGEVRRRKQSLERMRDRTARVAERSATRPPVVSPANDIVDNAKAPDRELGQSAESKSAAEAIKSIEDL
jgi:hypothetical protein